MADLLDEHYGYLADRAKRDCYQATIDRITRPEHVVLDLGCGSGLLGLLALRAGARQVLFVDEAPVIEMARRAVTQAGFVDRASFYQARSYELELPMRADIVLCDHVGYFGFDYDILRLLADAKARFLRPGGLLVPGRIHLDLAPVESASSRALLQRWRDGSVPDDYAWVAASAANLKHAVTLQGSDLIGASARLATLELGAAAPDFLNWRASFECARDASLDGLAGWFDCVLCDGIHMTNSPEGDGRISRPQAFLPLERPVKLQAGHRIEVSIMARPQDHVLAWTVELPSSGDRFTHSTFFSLALESSVRRGPAAVTGR
jgi:protein arginine N-methyltransferase 1